MTIPHSWNKEHTPVTWGVAILVPVRAPWFPPGKNEIISSPGAKISGLLTQKSISPSPEKIDAVSVLEL